MSKIVWCYAPIHINPGGKVRAMGGDLTINWVNLKIVGIRRQSNVSKQTPPGGID
jgi:hypothetical protein